MNWTHLGGDYSNLLDCVHFVFSGSGKTLAYLLPVLQMLFQRKQLSNPADDAMSSPSVIILVPAKELADQIMVVTLYFC